MRKRIFFVRFLVLAAVFAAGMVLSLMILKHDRWLIYGWVVLLVAVLLFWFWDLHLTRRVQEKTKQLRNSEERLRAIFQNSPDSMYIEDENGMILEVNPQACAMQGMPYDKLVGMNGGELVPSGQREVMRRDFHKWFTGELQRYEGQLLRSDGETVAVEVIGAPVRYEGHRAVLLQVRDMTARKKAEAALQESEVRYRSLFEDIPHIAVQGYNSDHEVIFWNKASENLYQYSRSEAVGKKVEDLVIPPDQRAELTDAIDRWGTIGQGMNADEMIKQRADGTTVSVYSSRLETRNRKGERELYVVDVDLSELRRANEELVKAKQFAERANRAKSEFLANISHEIRTPMNGVMGMTNLLLETGLDEEQLDLAQTVLDSTKDLMVIIDELLDISRIEAGEVQLQMEPFFPRETVEKVTALFADRAMAKEVLLTVAVHPDVPDKMMGDAGRIRQVLINLVGNALKFTDDGHIQIRLQVERADDGWNLIADVKDTGIGMTPELQKRVFDKFTQGDSSSTRQHGGAGLGLSITRQLVELMGGKISVSSEVGKGTSFEFNLILPFLEEKSLDVSETAPAAPRQQVVDADILLVEDNRVNQKVAVAMIKRFGGRVTVAVNGAEALKKISDQRFDLIFMDCQMPIMDGFETTRTIRGMEGEIRDIPIIAMTAHALKEDRRNCLDAGMDDYLSKPVDKDKLGDVLQKFCEVGSPGSVVGKTKPGIQ